MKWVLIGSLLGSLIHSEHDNREACEGRLVLLKEKGVNAKCVELTPTLNFTTHQGTGITQLCANQTCSNMQQWGK